MEEYDYARQAARALMTLRQESIREVCAATGISEQTLACFLKGHDVALSDASFHLLFQHLGVCATEEGAKLAPNRVHFFHMSSAAFKKRRHIAMFRTLLPLMDGVCALQLPRHKGVTPILVRGPRSRIVLLVRNGWIGGITMQKLGLVPGSFRGYETIAQIPEYYRDLLINKQVRANYFDLILEGSFKNESIDLVRLVALDRDVTLSEIVASLVQGKVGPSGDRSVMIDETAYYQEKVVQLFPNHFRARAAA
ncbi:MAG: hypothetical protein AB1768_18270 [Pseudomonadota bacterium]